MNIAWTGHASTTRRSSRKASIGTPAEVPPYSIAIWRTQTLVSAP